jgi:hypothetical protein
MQRGGMMVNLGPPPSGRGPSGGGDGGAGLGLRSTSRINTPTVDPADRGSGNGNRFDPGLGSFAQSGYRDAPGSALNLQYRDSFRSRAGGGDNMGSSPLGPRAERYAAPRSDRRSPRRSPSPGRDERRGSFTAGGGGGDGGGGRTPRERASGYHDLTIAVTHSDEESVAEMAPRRTVSARQQQMAPRTTALASALGGTSYRERSAYAAGSPAARSEAHSEASFAPRLPAARRPAERVEVNHQRQDTQAYREDGNEHRAVGPSDPTTVWRRDSPPRRESPQREPPRESRLDARDGERRAEAREPPRAAPEQRESRRDGRDVQREGRDSRREDAARQSPPPQPARPRETAAQRNATNENSPSAASRLARQESRRNLAGVSTRPEVLPSPRQMTPTAQYMPPFPPTGADEFVRERFTATQRELANVGRKLKQREDEILKLRHGMRRLAAEIGPSAAATADSLLPGAPPAHAAGLALLPVPLHLPKPVVQQHGYLDMLDVEHHTFTSRKWKRRYVVADDRGVTTYRRQEDYVANAFHRAKEILLYRQCEHFVPNVANSLDRLPHDASLTNEERKLMLHAAASETNRLYFGFVTRQPPGLATSEPVNPTMLFRTESIQEHEDWAHFLARMFNSRLYRASFPMLFADAAEVSGADSDRAAEEEAAAEEARQREEEAAAAAEAIPAAAEASPEERAATDAAAVVAADAAQEAAANVGTDDDTVRDLGAETTNHSFDSDHGATPRPPRNPPPFDALSARKPLPLVEDLEVQTDVTVSRRRGERLVLLGRGKDEEVQAGASYTTTDGLGDNDGPAAADLSELVPRLNRVAPPQHLTGPLAQADVPLRVRFDATTSPPPPWNRSTSEVQTVLLDPQALAHVSGCTTVDELIRALKSSAVPGHAVGSPANRTPSGIRIAALSAPGDDDAPMDAFAVAGLQAELLQLRNRLTGAEASCSAHELALRSKNDLVTQLERDLAQLREDFAAADATARSLGEAHDVAEKDLDQLRAQLDGLRRAASASPPKPAPPSRSVESTAPAHGRRSSGIKHARTLAQGSRRRRQVSDDDYDDSADRRHHRRYGYNGETYSTEESAYSDETTTSDATDSDSVTGTSTTGSMDLEDLEFGCRECRDMYRELTRVVDERDGLMREVARRHHEYTTGIAHMCDQVIDDMDLLHEHYRSGGPTAGAGAGLPPDVAVLLDPDAAPVMMVSVQRGADASDAARLVLACAVDASRAELIGISAPRANGRAVPMRRTWRVRDLVSGATVNVTAEVSTAGLTRTRQPAAARYGYGGGAHVSTKELVLRGPVVKTVEPGRRLGRQAVSTAVVPHAVSP